jgi:hypothetical protein
VALTDEGLIARGYEVLPIGNRRVLEGAANFEPAAEAWDGAIRRDARRWGSGQA